MLLLRCACVCVRACECVILFHITTYSTNNKQQTNKQNETQRCIRERRAVSSAYSARRLSRSARAPTIRPTWTRKNTPTVGRPLHSFLLGREVFFVFVFINVYVGALIKARMRRSCRFRCATTFTRVWIIRPDRASTSCAASCRPRAARVWPIVRSALCRATRTCQARAPTSSSRSRKA